MRSILDREELRSAILALTHPGRWCVIVKGGTHQMYRLFGDFDSESVADEAVSDALEPGLFAIVDDYGNLRRVVDKTKK